MFVPLRFLSLRALAAVTLLRGASVDRRSALGLGTISTQFSRLELFSAQSSCSAGQTQFSDAADRAAP